ncbi:MAG: Holliday junction resolvase-like protein [Planctomycetota bacterium]
MSKPGIATPILDLLAFYKQEKNIYGRCPHCGEVFRLSDVKLTYGAQPPRDLLTTLRAERDRLEEKIQGLEGELEETKEEVGERVDEVNEEWKGKVGREVDKAIKGRERELRASAVQKSRQTMIGKTLERIAPLFKGFGHHIADVRPLFEPVDFIIFDGLYSDQVHDIVFVEFKTGGSALSTQQKSIRSAVEKKRVHFEEMRIPNNVIKAMEGGGKQLIERK